MPPKGISEEEKKLKLLNYMLESGQVYSNATIEQCSKPTGISGMVIKSVVQALADEGRVDTDKVGNSTYYWAFKTKQSARLKDEQTSLENQVKSLSD